MSRPTYLRWADNWALVTGQITKGHDYRFAYDIWDPVQSIEHTLRANQVKLSAEELDSLKKLNN